MRKAVLISVASLVFGVLGAVLRRMELGRAFETETGLPTPMHPLTLGLVAFCVAFAALAAIAVLLVKRSSDGVRAKVRVDLPVVAVLCVAGVCAAGSGTLTVYYGMGVRTELIMGILSVLCGVCAMLLGLSAHKKLGGGRAPALYILAFLCFRLIMLFRDNGADPVLLNYVYPLLATVAMMMSVYTLCGSLFENPHPYVSIFFSMAAVFLSCIALADVGTPDGALMYACYIFFSLGTAFIQSSSLRKAGKSEISEE